MGKKLTDGALLSVMKDELGTQGTVVVLGWCALFAAAGAQGLDGIIRSGIGSIASRYRIASEIKRVRDRLARDGYELTEQVEDPAQLLALSQDGGRLRVALAD